MVHKKTRLIITLLLVVMCSLISLQGCSFLRKFHTPTEEKGISLGFQYENRQGSLITAIKSDKKVFDIDDVTLDFYYGGIAHGYSHCNSVALYFSSNGVFDYYVDDYKNVDGYYFIKEMTIDEFESEPFDIEIRWSPKKEDKKYEAYFHYVNTWTIPQELFSEQTGRISFFIANIVLDTDDNSKYKLIISGPASAQSLYYSKNDDGTVELRTRR